MYQRAQVENNLDVLKDNVLKVACPHEWFGTTTTPQADQQAGHRSEMKKELNKANMMEGQTRDTTIVMSDSVAIDDSVVMSDPLSEIIVEKQKGNSASDSYK